MLKSLSDTDLISSLKDSKLNDGSFNTLVPSLKGRLLYHQRTGLAWLSSLSAGSLIFREKHPLLQTAFSLFSALCDVRLLQNGLNLIPNGNVLSARLWSPRGARTLTA